MAAEGIATATYLEKFVDNLTEVPAELQRILSTIRELDRRTARLRESAQEKVDACASLPSAQTRSSKPDVVKELTKEVKDIHDAMTLIANEKIRLAQMALDLVKGNAALLDAELKLFHKELEEQGINPEDEFDAESYMPPPAPPPTKLSKLQHSQDKRAQAAAYVAQRKVPSTVTSLGIGDLVAANIGVLNQHAGGQEWIVATVTRYSPADGVFEIVDADEEAEKHVYRLPQKYVIPLPKTAAVRHSQNFPAGTSVLAVYPNTTTFYKANVVQSARRLPNAEYSEFVLEFEDDGDVEGDAPAHRAVPFRHVVLFPG